MPFGFLQKMSAAKAKRREKKMRNQPANVQYPSPPQVESRAENGGGGEGLHVTGTRCSYS